MSKRLKVVCTVSLLANVLLAGGLTGVIMDRSHDMPWDKVKEGLSPEGRKEVAHMFQNTWKDMGSTMRQSMDNRKYLAEVISADKFDPVKFDEAVKRIRGVQDLITDKKTKSTRELLTKLSVNDRRKLADIVANSFSWKASATHHDKHDYPRPPEHKDGKDAAAPADHSSPPPPADQPQDQ